MANNGVDWRVFGVLIFVALIETYWLFRETGSKSEQHYIDQLHNLRLEIDATKNFKTNLADLTAANQALTNTNEGLLESFGTLQKSNDALLESNDVLKKSNEALTESNEALTESNSVLTEANKNLRKENADAVAEVKKAKKSKKEAIGAPPPPPKPAPGAVTAQTAFENIYKLNIWGGRDDPQGGNGSGLGSAPQYTVNAQKILREVFIKYKLKKLLDAPCGAMVWMPILLKNLTEEIKGFEYLGVDVVRDVIKGHRKKFKGTSNWHFQLCDIAYCSLPLGYDLIFSRDALQHLSYDLIFKYLQNVKESDAKYLMVGTYYNHTGTNRNIETGDYFLINLLEPPFSLPKPLEIFFEGTYGVFAEKFLLLWKIEDLQHWNPPDEYRQPE